MKPGATLLLSRRQVAAMLDVEGTGRSKLEQPDYSAFKRD